MQRWKTYYVYGYPIITGRLYGYIPKQRATGSRANLPQLCDPCMSTLSDGSSRGAFRVLEWAQWGQFCGAVAQVSPNLQLVR